MVSASQSAEDLADARDRLENARIVFEEALQGQTRGHGACAPQRLSRGGRGIRQLVLQLPELFRLLRSEALLVPRSSSSNPYGVFFVAHAGQSYAGHAVAA
jgi:hypothetical protein